MRSLRGGTYKNPIAKTKYNHSFCLSGSVMLRTTGRGRKKMTKSEMMLMPVSGSHLSSDLKHQLSGSRSGMAAKFQ